MEPEGTVVERFDGLFRQGSAVGFGCQGDEEEPEEVNGGDQGTSLGVIVMEGGEEVGHLQVTGGGDDPPEVEAETLTGGPHRGGEQLRQIERQPAVEGGRNQAHQRRREQEGGAVVIIEAVEADHGEQ